MRVMNDVGRWLCAGASALAWAGAAQAAASVSAGGLSLVWTGGSAAMAEGVTAAVNGLDWVCGPDGCSLNAAPRIDFVFGAGPTGTRLVTDEKLTFGFEITRTSDVSVLDPLGKAHSLVPLLGQWSFGLDVLSNPVPPYAQINTAHGRVDWEVGTGANGDAWSWRPDRFPADAAGVSEILDDALVVKHSQRLPSGWGGSLQAGPGVDGDAGVVPVGATWGWELGTQVFSPYYALPSTTDPRCAALSCMDMAPGVLVTGGYRLSVATQWVTAVPEPSVMALSGLGLAVGGVWARRRQRC